MPPFSSCARGGLDAPVRQPAYKGCCRLRNSQPHPGLWQCAEAAPARTLASSSALEHSLAVPASSAQQPVLEAFHLAADVCICGEHHELAQNAVPGEAREGEPAQPDAGYHQQPALASPVASNALPARQPAAAASSPIGNACVHHSMQQQQAEKLTYKLMSSTAAGTPLPPPPPPASNGATAEAQTCAPLCQSRRSSAHTKNRSAPTFANPPKVTTGMCTAAYPITRQQIRKLPQRLA